MATNLGSDTLTSVTNTTRDPWQESLPRWHTVPASHVAQAAEVIRGLAGSWAASYQFDYGVKNENRPIDAKVGNPSQVKSNNLGHPGFPEINFVPYNHGTNRFGSKGGSFIGHPISFDVVGPTGKSPETDFYWDVIPLGDNDELKCSAGLIANVFGVGVVDLPVYYPGGLYVVITQTGSPGSLKDQDGIILVGGGGIGDGCDPSGLSKNGIAPLTPHSKYEIFRVVSIREDFLVLDKGKRLADYFTLPAVTPIIQSLMLIQPKATRLVAIPGSGGMSTIGGMSYNLAKTFAVVPPKRALLQDDQYKYATWTGVDWNEKNLSQYPLGTGTDFEYRYGPKLPIPRPISYWNGRLRGIDPATAALEAVPVTQAGTFILHPDALDPGFGADTKTDLVGKIIHIHNVQSRNGAELKTDTTGIASDFKRDFTSLMGWFEVIAWSGVYYTVRRVSETDPNTGFPVIGSSQWYGVESSALALYKTIEVNATVHDPIESLWKNGYADIDTIQSARLTNLIDPRWVERSVKSAGSAVSPTTVGISPDRSDRSIFDTSSVGSGTTGTNANPGSLLDLGFRTVLFPGKMGVEKNPVGGADLNVIVPDWDHPITSNEVLLDPAKPQEKQYIEVDYANGLVRLSHQIQSGSTLLRDTNILTAAGDNPRKEMVLFASCVPYSQEEGQMSAGGVRVLGGQSLAADGASCADPGASDATDVFSGRIVATVDQSSGGDGLVRSVNHIVLAQSVFLQGDWVYKIPPSGFFELLYGTSANDHAAIGDTYYRGSLFGYTGVQINGDRTLTELKNVYGGGRYGAIAVNTSLPTVAVFRREVVTPNDVTGKAGVSYAYDTTYGSAKRTPVLRFEDSDVSANVDGTMTIRIKTADATGNFDDLFSSWVLEKGTVSAVATPPINVTVTVEPHVILMRGHRLTVPTSAVAMAIPGTYYIYYEHNDGKSCPQCLATIYFPLLHPEDILIAKVIVPGGFATYTLTPLQNPLTDIDKRVDIYVGEMGWDGLGYPAPLDQWNGFEPHFRTLWEAVEYANNMMVGTFSVPYQNIHIKVIGRTFEPAAKLPIQIKTNGLIIEGHPHYAALESAPGVLEITWGEVDGGTAKFEKSLFDLNGMSDLIFRNLAFRSKATVVSDVSLTGGCNVFTNTTGTPQNLIIDNCRSVGYVNDFIHLSVGGGITQSWITNNVVYHLSSGAVTCISDSASIADLVISGNVFQGAPNRVLVTAAIDIHCATTPLTTFMDAMQVNTNINIRDNFIFSSPVGIWAVSQSGSISDNYIYQTQLEGVVTAGGWEIRNNYLQSIYTKDSPPKGNFDAGDWSIVHTARRHGIRHYTQVRNGTVAVFSGKIVNNRVEMDYQAGADKTHVQGILVTGSPNPIENFNVLQVGTCGGAVAALEIQLDGAASAIDDFYLGCMVTLTNALPAGVVLGETRKIIAYDGGTKIATVDAAWTVDPNATTTFKVYRAERGYTEIVEGNWVGFSSGFTSLASLSNLRVDSAYGKVSGNTCRALEVCGTACEVQGNAALHMGINFDTALTSENPNRSYLDRNAVSNNTVSSDGASISQVYLWSGTMGTNNRFGYSDAAFVTVTHVRDDCKLTSNVITRLEDFDGVGTITGASARLAMIGNEVGAISTDGTLDLLGPFEITGNRFGNTVIIPNCTDGTIANNSFARDLEVGTGTASAHFTVSGNKSSIKLTIGSGANVASDGVVSGNQIHNSAGTSGIVVYGNRINIVGNSTVYDDVKYGPFSLTGNINAIGDNVLGATSITGNENTFNGNQVLGTLTFIADSDSNVIVGNSVTEAFALAGSFTRVQGNDFASTTTLIGSNQVFGNNNSGGTLALFGANSVIQGNRVTGNISATGLDNVIQGNRFTGDISIWPGSRCIVDGNLGAVATSVLDIRSGDQVVTGNRVYDITFADSLSNVVVSGNMVTHDVTFGAVGATQTDSVVLSGNWIGNWVLPGSDQGLNIVAMGNVVKGALILGIGTGAASINNAGGNSNV